MNYRVLGSLHSFAPFQFQRPAGTLQGRFIAVAAPVCRGCQTVGTTRTPETLACLHIIRCCVRREPSVLLGCTVGSHNSLAFGWLFFWDYRTQQLDGRCALAQRSMLSRSSIVWQFVWKRTRVIHHSCCTPKPSQVPKGPLIARGLIHRWKGHLMLKLFPKSAWNTYSLQPSSTASPSPSIRCNQPRCSNSRGTRVWGHLLLLLGGRS